MKKRINRFVYWAPRILSILFILFLAIFSLDVFDANAGFWGTLLGLFMHNIPSLILLVVLIIAWKHELVGAVVYILVGLLFTILIMSRIELSMVYMALLRILPIAGPAFLVGILFLINWHLKRKGG